MLVSPPITLRTAGATAVRVTHDQDEALSMADQLAVLRNGVVAQVGTPQAVYHSPVDAFTATFVGDAVLLHCTVTGRRATTDVLGGLDLDGPTRDGAALAVVRPEHLEVLPAATDRTAAGTTAQVSSVQFYGHDAVVHLTLSGTDTTLQARARSNPLPEPGDHVQVRVDAPVTCVAV